MIAKKKNTKVKQGSTPKKAEVSTPKATIPTQVQTVTPKAPISGPAVIKVPQVSEEQKIKAKQRRIQEIRRVLRRDGTLMIPEDLREAGYDYYFASTEKQNRINQLEQVGYSKVLNKKGKQYSIYGGTTKDGKEYKLILLKIKLEDKALINEAKRSDVLSTTKNKVLPSGINPNELYTKKGMGDLDSITAEFNIKQL
jgi:hypothetical protein